MSRKKITDQDGNVYYVEEEPSASEKIQNLGKGMESCGCLLTLFITIPILIFLALLFF